MAIIDGVRCYNFRIYVKRRLKYCATFNIDSFRKTYINSAYLLYDTQNNPFKRTFNVSRYIVKNIKRYKI